MVPAYIEAPLLFLMTASQRYAMDGMKKPSKYLIDIGERNTMHIVKLPALLDTHFNFLNIFFLSNMYFEYK